MVSFYEDQLVGVGKVEEDINLPRPDPLVLELNRLQNLVKDRDRELGAAQGEVKALRATEALKDKAIEELHNELNKREEKRSATQSLLEHKNLEIKKLIKEKKDALASQYAAEATLRRVHANLRDNDSPPIESFIAPLEAEIKMYKNEIASLQEDKKAMERLTKSKESALLEAERILKSALERALIVEEVQNQNFELKRQIEICQEENKILDKTNRQKVLEVEKLSQTIQELEEVILNGGAAANAIRDYRRQISMLNEEKRMLERELARAKVSANRVATVVANEWKDENDKVMPVKQWLEERRLLQGEMQRLRDKLAVTERTAKAEAQMKERFKMRLKTLEEGLKHASICSVNSNTLYGCVKPEKTTNVLGFLTSNGDIKKRSTSQPRGSTFSRNSPLHQPTTEIGKLNDSFKNKYGAAENMLKRGIWAPRSKVIDNNEKENTVVKANTDACTDECKNDNTTNSSEVKNKGNNSSDNEDVVSGFLYDRLQKEVINLRKTCEAKDSSLNAKEQEIQMLIRKVDTLTKAVEVEFKKAKREAAAKERELVSAKVEQQIKKVARTNSPRRYCV
ncbi:hypothetical protein K2173_017939 [Erythroxylum novogranatense]|uniref:Microtubule-associated protein 70-5 n=1 Tax=Erythroxylum novogranatense TaxID=1862640 RepID=A0AAV8TXM9_9ROSI|nr:hypothetical protein K2173_017939 [Erythroxylum novogranatense]